jgi:hypothetical protein
MILESEGSRSRYFRSGEHNIFAYMLATDATGESHGPHPKEEEEKQPRVEDALVEDALVVYTRGVKRLNLLEEHLARMAWTPHGTLPDTSAYMQVREDAVCDMYIARTRRDAVRYEQERAEEVALIRAWLREHLKMVIPSVSGNTVDLFGFVCMYLWDCIVRARCELKLRRLELNPVAPWVRDVFGITVVNNTLTLFAGMLGSRDMPKCQAFTLAEHDARLRAVRDVLEDY